MKVLVFDTETTGLPIGRNPCITETEKWPHIVQLSYILYDTDTKKMILCKDHIIKIDPTIEITEESINIHGITRKICDRKGINIIEAINEFNVHLTQSDCVVGHNLSFDKRMIMVECIRNTIRQQFTVNRIRMPECCTMQFYKPKCAIERISKNGYKYLKYPSLTETHEYLFNFKPKNTHDSMADVLICLRCYVYGLHSNQDILKHGCSAIKELYTLYCL